MTEKEKTEVIAQNREVEARLWARIARGSPPGSAARNGARERGRVRREQARRLRSESELFFGLFGEELDE